jgi:hypothetical protein
MLSKTEEQVVEEMRQAGCNAVGEGKVKAYVDMRESYQTVLDEGMAALKLPGQMSSASVDHFEEWMTVILKRLRRNASNEDRR